MSNTTALILTGSGYSLQVTPEAEAEKLELLKHASLIVEVKDNTSADTARNQVKKLAAMRNLVEKSRKSIKEPVLAIGREIDQKASDFVAELVEQEKRLTGLIGEHAAEVERQRQEAERERLRLEREAQLAREKAEREAREAEERRLKAERDAEEARLRAEKEAAQAAPDDIDAQIEAAQKIDEANAARKLAEQQREQAIAAEQARQAEAERLAEESRKAALLANTQSTSGVKFDYDFEVVDIHQLYRFAPDLVEITPRRREVLAKIKAAATGDTIPTIPGLNVTRKAVVSTR